MTRGWLGLALTLGACSGSDPAPARDAAPPIDAPPAALTLTSPAFVDGGTLPVDYTCDGRGVSPPLAWAGAPAGTAELALLMTTQAPDGLKWNWVLYRLPPAVAGLAEGATGVGTAGRTSDGPALAYAPPCSQGPGPKTYVFTLYALSAAPSVPSPPSAVTGDVLSAAIGPLTLARGALTVTYTRP